MRIPLLTQKPGVVGPRRFGRRDAFTMIEIAISLAIIGFALVAIIGILPTGLNVQKDTRQETIIIQDASVFMEAFRSGARGADDLTNYVLAITNYTTQYGLNGNVLRRVEYGYTPTTSTIDGSAAPDPFPLLNGYRIIGLLATPKYTARPQVAYQSNHVVAFVRSISGPAAEKMPQDNPIMQDLALTYRMICEVSPIGTNYYHPLWINTANLDTNSALYFERVAYSNVLRNLQANLHDVRLTFRWPLLPNGETGPNRQFFRTMVSGELVGTNTVGFERGYPPGVTNFLYFFEPRTYRLAMP
jgi:type II secretory pathway pseudopilin PulG